MPTPALEEALLRKLIEPRRRMSIVDGLPRPDPPPGFDAASEPLVVGTDAAKALRLLRTVAPGAGSNVSRIEGPTSELIEKMIREGRPDVLGSGTELPNITSDEGETMLGMFGQRANSPQGSVYLNPNIYDFSDLVETLAHELTHANGYMDEETALLSKAPANSLVRGDFR
jgi:hypothetical protein